MYFVRFIGPLNFQHAANATSSLLPLILARQLSIRSYLRQAQKTNKWKMTKLKFSSSLEISDPRKHPVTIIGQLEHLKSLDYNVVKPKLAERVSDEVFKSALESLHPSPTDSCSLYLNLASIVALPNSVSRHNTPSRASSITKVAKCSHNGVDEFIVMVCEKKYALPSACAIAKAFPLYCRKSGKTDKIECNVTVEFLLVTPNGDGSFKIGSEQLENEDLKVIELATQSVRHAARIVDTPCAEMHTDRFVEEAKSIAKELGIEPYIVRGEDLNERGFGGIYGVGKAAVNPPALVVLSHKPAGASKTIAWVGKGIVFDTGGLSIKSKTAMCSMKKDCGGAAAILNAFYLAVKTGFKENLHAVLCLAENAVGPKSYRPDDILTMYSNKTVEINNTDAEGRLVLADGVAFAKKDLKADIIVDMATLTGAQAIATGKLHGAVLTNSEEWEAGAVRAGKHCGELCFPLVFAPELHFPEFNSVVADMKNSVGDRSNAQSSCAGLFILSHLGFDFPGTWVHIDMAAPAESGDRATGYGVLLLNSLFGQWSSSSIFQCLSANLPK